jgi:hypothetical protein
LYGIVIDWQTLKSQFYQIDCYVPIYSTTPMVAIPVTNDQPGVAARIAWTGAGEVIPLGKVNVKRLQKAIRQVLTDVSTGKPVLA